jgi:two-component system LytT family sensor kinase
MKEIVKKRLFFVGVWTFFVIYFSIDFTINLRARGVVVSFWQPLYYNFIYFYLWIPLSIFIIGLVRWLGRRNIKRWGALLVQLPLSALLAFLHNVVQFYLNSFLIQVLHLNISTIFRDENFGMFSLRYFAQNIWIYWVVVGVVTLIDYYRLYRENELKSARLEIQLIQTQLQVLKMQIHPHFLFNTINSILALMHDDPAGAERMAIQLSDFLRYTLDNIDRQEVILKEELDFVQRYLDIEKVRLQDRLTVTMEVDPDTLTARVPNLMLQPLVENSVRHGIVPYSRRGHIHIGCRSSGKNLRIQVHDDGPGFPAASPSALRKGVGLTNIEKRLETLYDKQDFMFSYRNHPQGGALVEIVIPLRRPSSENHTALLS